MCADIIVYTDPIRPGTAQIPAFSIGDDQNWSLLFNNGTNFYNPAGVSMKLGFVKGLPDGTYASAFAWVDRMCNQHVGSFSISSAVVSALTWDENPLAFLGGDGAWLLRGRIPPSRSIRKVNVIDGGSAISSAPAVRFAGGAEETGQGATGTATIGGGATITGISVTSPGRGYNPSNPPEVIITGDGTGAKAVAVVGTTVGTNYGEITGFTMVAVGASYTTATVTIRNPEATATASVGGTSAITSLVLTQGGGSYTSAPTVAFTGGGGASAAADAVLAASAWALLRLTLTNAGSGYTSNPTVSFSGGGGSGAAAIAQVSANNYLTGLTLVSPGTYSVSSGTFPPSGQAVLNLSFSGGGGAGAAGQALVADAGGGAIQVISVNLTAAGTGYTSAPTVSIDLASNPGFALTATTAASVTATISSGAVLTLTLTNPGVGYTSAPTVSFSGGGGTGAAATAVLTGSPVVALTITNAGSGYTSAPVVSFSGGGGTGAAATATVTLGLTAITMGQGGYAYTSRPAIQLIPDNGAVLEPAGIETYSVPFVRKLNPISAMQAILPIPRTNGRRSTADALLYDDSILLIRPQVLLSPTFTLANDGLTWRAVFNPGAIRYVLAVLNFRRSVSLEMQIYGGGRLLYNGYLTIFAVSP